MCPRSLFQLSSGSPKLKFRFDELELSSIVCPTHSVSFSEEASQGLSIASHDLSTIRIGPQAN